jgi:hypothetical protein
VVRCGGGVAVDVRKAHVGLDLRLRHDHATNPSTTSFCECSIDAPPVTGFNHSQCRFPNKIRVRQVRARPTPTSVSLPSISISSSYVNVCVCVYVCYCVTVVVWRDRSKRWIST